MTCEEFMDAAGGLTPSQLLQMRSAEDQPLVAHVGECGACREWLESHRVLGNALHALSASTAPLEASPKVEQMLLQAFRKQEFAPRAVELTQKAAKSLWTLSRFFEAGAYAAVAAALVVGVFLGARILRDQQNKTNRAQLQVVNAPQSDKAAAAAQNSEARTTAQAPQVATKAHTSIASSAVEARKQSAPAASQANSTENGGFVALMLCDPLICSGDEQVIRMELPASAVTGVDSGTTQTVLADVVIGDDGLVRRMRIVN